MARLANFFPPPMDEFYQFLSGLEVALKRLILFADKMPDIFAESLSGVAEGPYISTSGAARLYTAFVYAVDRYEFPLFVDWALQDDAIVIDEIPLMVFGIGTDDLDGAFDSLIALYFAVYHNGFYPTDIGIFEPDDIAALLPIDESDDGNIQRIKERLRALPAGHPARGALASLRLIEREDANIFLACNYSDGNNDIVWDEYYFNMLAEEWAEAKPVVDAHFTFVNWSRDGAYEREEAFIRYIGGAIDELDENIFARKENES